jgi:hypothetical protein
MAVQASSRLVAGSVLLVTANGGRHPLPAGARASES